MNSYIKQALCAITLALIAALANSKAQAQELPSKPCQKLEQQACLTKEVIPGKKACTWVQGYKTLAGNVRKSYCRASNKKA